MERKTGLLCALLVLASGCGAAPNSALSVQLWGGAFSDSIPELTDMEPGFADGWSLTYSKVLVNLGEVSFSGTLMGGAGSVPGYRVWDLHAATAPASMATVMGLAPQRFDSFGYTIRGATTASMAGNVTVEDLQRMRTNGYSVYLEGTAMHPTQGRYSFAWGFTTNTGYTRCNDAAMEAGVLLSGATATAQVTIHSEAPFVDDLGAGPGSLRFDPLAAADTNMDRMVTLEELGAVSLAMATLPMGSYGTGSVARVTTLRDFVTAQVANMGRFQGEGRCTVTRR